MEHNDLDHDELQRLQELWMRAVLRCARHQHPLGWAQGALCDHWGLAWDDDAARVWLIATQLPRLRTGKKLFGGARPWLARFFRPVWDAMIDGREDGALVELWKHTKRGDRGVQPHPQSLGRDRDRARMQGAHRGYAAWAHGWRAKSDWKTVK
jgi:hypothetical protein